MLSVQKEPDKTGKVIAMQMRNKDRVDIIGLQPLAPQAPRAAPKPGPMGFRTGLTDADLGLTAEEHREFE